ncbi:MAG TPA: GNAT family protein [Sphingomicrobium sp.]
MADEIRTKRLLLRRARMTDLPAIHAMLSDPVAMCYWSTSPHTNIGQSEDWLRSMVDADLSISDDFCVELDGQVIGKLGCWKLPEIGFLFDPAHWGQGFASEAMAAFLKRRRAIGSPDVITADVDPRNAGSLNLLRRHGFVETGRAARTWHVGGEWCDSVYLELTL